MGDGMRERPILMTPENAQKCHEGTKTQTRRIVNPQPPYGCEYIINGAYSHALCRSLENPRLWVPPTAKSKDHRLPCPYGVVGDRLWVRENGWERPARTPKMLRDGADTWERFYFDALLDAGEAEELKGYGFKRRRSIHMPRWACRTVLEITDVRVERLQEITVGDAMAEGVTRVDQGREYYFSAMRDEPDHRNWVDSTDAYKELWESINGVASWAMNPWVWVISFRKVG